MGPQTEFAQHLHADKYRSEGETFREAMNRVASELRDSDEHYHTFREMLAEMRFMPGGRIQASMGSSRGVTAFNCFVGATIEDTFCDGDRSIMSCAHRGAVTLRMGGGLGNDFSTLRPRGATIRKLQSTSGGPLSFMPIFDAVGAATKSSGHRRGAQMGVLRVDHPDIEEFIHAKRKEGHLEGFNMSVGVTDAFMEAMLADRDFDLVFEGHTYKTVRARSLWDNIMRSAWDWAEPGVLFLDTINRMNNLWWMETLAATNPCGEQPLPPDGACLLGSFNLVKYLGVATAGPARSEYVFNWEQFKADIAPVVRAMDNVIDRTTYPLYEQEKEAKSKRRMGLGVTGMANAFEAMGMPYGSESFLQMENDVLRCLLVETYRASVELAGEKGPFPAFRKDEYLQSGFIQMHMELFEQEGILDGIREHGIRNSHLTSIAPTGTISWAADNVSSGVEPVIAYKADRVYISPDGPRTVEVEDYGVLFLGVRGKRPTEVTAQEHVNVLTAAAHWVDSAVSKTCNVTGDMPWEDFKGIYLSAWERGAKGCTIYNHDGKRGALITSKDESCQIDPDSGRRECD